MAVQKSITHSFSAQPASEPLLPFPDVETINRLSSVAV
jgi:hypothetical protein